ncbi:ATP-grasp domain-containing protein [Streptomyces sp. G-G2]|uniref:ATP-grasp domain-containing protein n=1 Tax=Streptomyces sp. G-G2 TaxID=3046201 RepID=UPI0024BA5EF9|nr:ATP-grasp domain-containing protein [Streptomyces sp. G-G2]MDJ0382928.1 ATP-grasp domain-containing protein [Streptomyces sp. G-G2]
METVGNQERHDTHVTAPGTVPVAVLLGPRPAVIAAARRAGARTVVVAPGPSVPSDREGAERPVRADWRDHQSLTGELARLAAVREGRAAVFGFDAATALAAARANEALGLPGTRPDTVTALMDKAALRARTNKALHPGWPVSFARCGRADLLPFIAGLIGYPCVVKPRAGADGEGVRRLSGPADARAAAGAYPEITDLLVEELLEGPELAVEALSRAGRHQILGWTRRLPGPGLTVADHRLPVPLDARLAESLRSLVRRVLDLARHRDGPSHTEVVLTARGPRLIEAHPHPGALEPTLLRLATGTDVLALAVAAGLGLPSPLRQPRAAHAALRYVGVTPPAPTALAAARALPGVIRVQLSHPHPYILATAPTAKALSTTLTQATTLLP